jgi:hypothetical protein
MMNALAGLSLYSRSMLVVCMSMALVITIEVFVIGSDSDVSLVGITPSTSGSQNESQVGPASLQIPPVVAYREVVERPLFTGSRRPPEEPEETVESVRAVQLGSKWKLTGIVVAGDDSFAHVTGIRDQKTVRLKIGEALDGWKLEEIAPDQIVFSSATDRVALRLHEEKKEARPVERLTRQ